MEDYLLTRRSVKYGQCWVFAGVLTTSKRPIFQNTEIWRRAKALIRVEASTDRCLETNRRQRRRRMEVKAKGVSGYTAADYLV